MRTSLLYLVENGLFRVLPKLDSTACTLMRARRTRGPPAETSLRDLPFDHSPTNNDTCAVDAASSINYNSLSDATATNANAMSEQRVTRTAPARTDHHGQDQLVGKEAVSAPANGPEANPFSFYPSLRLNGARRSDLSVINELEIKAEAQLLVLAAGVNIHTPA